MSQSEKVFDAWKNEMSRTNPYCWGEGFGASLRTVQIRDIKGAGKSCSNEETVEDSSWPVKDLRKRSRRGHEKPETNEITGDYG